MIQKTFLLLSVISILYACCNEKDKSLFYVIQTHNAEENKDLSFYSDKNFILYNDTTIYFFFNNQTNYIGCGTGIDFTKPSQLDLYPDSLSIVKFIDLKHFLDSISKIHSHHNKQLIFISSPKDTIRNKAFMVIRNYYQNKKNTLVGIRKSTEEETYVSTAKFTRKPYDPSKCKWKIGFSKTIPSDEQTLRFLPPIEK